VHEPTEGQVMPSNKYLKNLLTFLSTWACTVPILLHCRAESVGRRLPQLSPRAGSICFLEEQEVALALRNAAPLARPNDTLIELADHARGRQGGMSRAIAEKGRNLPWIFDTVAEGEPFEMPAFY
jgi:predicted protein tyrosine phosphatase